MLTRQERQGIADRAKAYKKGGEELNWDQFSYVLLGIQSWRNDDELLDRIVDLCDTSNMIELPVDKDGIPFKRGDTVYESDGTEHIVDGYAFSRANAKIVSVVDLINNTRILFETDELTHKRPVTIASVRKQLKHVLDKGEMTSWSMARLFDIAEQLDSLGDSDV